MNRSKPRFSMLMLMLLLLFLIVVGIAVGLYVSTMHHQAVAILRVERPTPTPPEYRFQQVRNAVEQRLRSDRVIERVVQEATGAEGLQVTRIQRRLDITTPGPDELLVITLRGRLLLDDPQYLKDVLDSIVQQNVGTWSDGKTTIEVVQPAVAK